MSEAWQTLIPAASTAFFLDVDGTLVGFKSRPEHVVADAALITLLQDLGQAAGGALALVSGRMVSDLDRIMAPLVLPAGGLHGADLRFADQRRAIIGAEVMDPVREGVRTFVAARPGLMLEDKGATLAVHFRHAPDRESEVQAFLETVRVGRDLMVQNGKLVAELKPAHCDKGHAILALMQTPPFQGRRPLFIGDDLTDEHGFRAVNDAGGISIKVGTPVTYGVPETTNAREPIRRPESDTLARYRVEDPQAVRDLLRLICRLADSR